MTMRFYRTGKTLRWTFTIFWIAILVGYLEEMLRRHTLGGFRPWIWIVLAIVQLWTLWGTYWTVDEDRLSFHGWAARRRDFDASRLRYAGPLRRPRLHWWNKDTLELDITGSMLPDGFNYVHTDHRKQLLDRLRLVAPQAEIVD